MRLHRKRGEFMFNRDVNQSAALRQPDNRGIFQRPAQESAPARRLQFFNPLISL
jgi:hypothetical protein